MVFIEIVDSHYIGTVDYTRNRGQAYNDMIG